MNRLFLLLLLQASAIVCIADEYKDPLSNVIYTYDPAGDRAKVKEGEEWTDTDDFEIGYSKPGSPDAKDEIVILDRFTVDGKEYIVNGIGQYAFFSMANITSVTIPPSVKSIGRMAFAECASLSDVVLSEGLETIQGAAFCSTALSSVTIPSSVQSISPMAFASPSIKTKTITSLIEEPFKVWDICSPDEKEQVTLLVPPGAKAKYEATSDWNQFGTIKEFLPTAITSPSKLQESSTYDLQGRPQQYPRGRGMYIWQGRKVVR